MKRIIIMTLLLPMLIFTSHAQDNDHTVNHRNELGIANSPVYIIKEKEFAYGLHLHYIRKLKDSDFGIGAGYERIFDDHKHNTIGLIGSYSPFESMTISISPGISFSDRSSGVDSGLHLEALYDFDIGMFHLGPVMEFSMARQDYHLSAGLHIGLGF